jgi:hypothetical protein
MDLSKPAPTGAVDLSKGSSVDLAKPGGDRFITVKSAWQDKKLSFGRTKKLDYDLFFHVAYIDGTREIVKFDNLRSRNGSVVHDGDQTTGGIETGKVRLTPDIAAVGFSLYSALENGEGSFADARASVEIDNGEGSKITLNVADMSVDPNRYTLYFGTVVNRGAEALTLTAHEDYSERGSEHQVVLYADGHHEMDAGPQNYRKD